MMPGGDPQPQVMLSEQPITLQGACHQRFLDTVFNKNCEQWSIPYYKIGFVLDGFDQMGANVSVLSRFGRSGVLITFSTWDIFNFLWVSWDGVSPQ